jgi:hypothetical protein
VPDPFNYLDRAKLLKGRGSIYLDPRPLLGANQGASSTPGVNPVKALAELLAKPEETTMAGQDQLAALMGLLQGKGGGLGVDTMYAPPNPVMDAMQGGANIQRGRFGMPQQAAQQPSDEQMLEQVRQGMGGEGDTGIAEVNGDDLEADQAAVESAPTDGNIEAFIEHWGENNLPESMGGSGSKNPPDYGEE